MVKRGPWLRPQASEGEAQHGPFKAANPRILLLIELPLALGISRPMFDVGCFPPNTPPKGLPVRFKVAIIGLWVEQVPF
jgi:hypothetical protein